MNIYIYIYTALWCAFMIEVYLSCVRALCVHSKTCQHYISAKEPYISGYIGLFCRSFADIFRIFFGSFADEKDFLTDAPVFFCRQGFFTDIQVPFAKIQIKN